MLRLLRPLAADRSLHALQLPVRVTPCCLCCESLGLSATRSVRRVTPFPPPPPLTIWLRGIPQIVPDGVLICLTHSGRPSGDAFVQLASEEAMQMAVKKDREKIDRRYVEVLPLDAHLGVPSVSC